MNNKSQNNLSLPFNESSWRLTCHELAYNSLRGGDEVCSCFVDQFSDSVESLVFTFPEDHWGKLFNIAKEYGYKTPSERDAYIGWDDSIEFQNILSIYSFSERKSNGVQNK